MDFTCIYFIIRISHLCQTLFLFTLKLCDVPAYSAVPFSMHCTLEIFPAIYCMQYFLLGEFPLL